MDLKLDELRELIDELGYSLNDLDNIEILAACTGVACQQSCQPACQPGCSNKP
ncbi:MAG: hypothetical protein IJ489_02140 [Clostridia bacterium]|nr:hypothetical protein [Clostridia bacterium]